MEHVTKSINELKSVYEKKIEACKTINEKICVIKEYQNKRDLIVNKKVRNSFQKICCSKKLDKD